MKLRSLLVVVVLVGLPSLARAQMPANAFVVDARFGAGLTVFGPLGGTVSVLAQPSLTVGGRLADRVQLGIGFAIYRLATPANNGNNDTTTFDFAPTVAIDILKAHDNKAAWYAKAALPMGAMFPSGARNLFVIGYDVALGVRYCPHPNFAAGLEGGLTGLFVDPNGNGGFGVTSVYGALVGTFYWGH